MPNVVKEGTPSVSLSTDVGEGFGNWVLADDESLLTLVTHANVACGFHAGDPDIMRHTCETCARQGVTIGAQVSYRDLVGFGRRYVAVPRASLVNDLVYQIGALQSLARVAGAEIGYVRPHGALHNVAATDIEHASAIAQAVASYDPSLPVFCQPHTELWEAAERAGIEPVAEAFVDRAYSPDGLLVPRSGAKADQSDPALLTDPARAAARAVRMVKQQGIETVDGDWISTPVQSLLVHSDTPGAVDIAAATRAALLDAGIVLR